MGILLDVLLVENQSANAEMNKWREGFHSAVSIWQSKYQENLELENEIDKLTSELQKVRQDNAEYRAQVVYYETTKPQVVEGPIVQTMTIYVPRVQAINGWDNVADLYKFLAENKVNEQRFLSAEHPDGRDVCALFAFALRRESEIGGRYLSWQLISDSDYEKLLRGEIPRYNHIMNMTEINGKFYLIEPQTDQVWEVAKWRD